MKATSAQLPQCDDSDDEVFEAPNAVIMLDGASAFVPVPVPASTYADHLAREVRGHFIDDPAAGLKAVLAESIRTTATALDLAPGKSPSSTVTIARTIGNEFEFLFLGDNLVILPNETLTDDRMDQLDLAPRSKYRERLAVGSSYDDEHKAVLRQLQTEQAEHRNRPAATDHAYVTRRPLVDVPWTVLATDGAYNTMSHLGSNDWRSLAAASADELHAVLHAAQRWEADQTP
jgi:hypothetical protein